ncbi:MAG TPA: VOC family protein [Pyrinomonadaceae bacterium]|nr:VOC family protein [Pyrinomonadaceae bacterium]
MNFSGLDRLFLEVNNLEESLAFYQHVLGFDVGKDNSDQEPPMATLTAGSLTLTLAQHLEPMLRRGRGVHFFIGVDDVDLFYERVRSLLPDIDAPIDEGWGGRFITLEDPNKYRFFFVTWDQANSI